MPTRYFLVRSLRLQIVVMWALLLFLALARPASATEPLPPTGPLGVVVDKQDTVWTAWYEGFQQFDGQGKLLEEYKLKNETTDALYNSTILAFAKNGYLYFFEYGKVQRLEPNSDYKIISAALPAQVTESAYARFAMSPIDNFPLTAYNITSEQTGGVYRHLSNGQLEQITQLINPTAITIGADDFLYIADRNQGAIIQFDPANYQEIQRWRYDDLKLATGDTITGVSDLAVDKAGNMYLANGDVYKFDQNGKLLTTFQVFKERLPIRGIAVDSKGNLYVAHFELSYGSNNHIAKYSANGNYLLQWQREEWQSSGCPMICPKGAGWLVLIAIALFVIAIPVTPLVLFIRWLLKPKPQQP